MANWYDAERPERGLSKLQRAILVHVHESGGRVQWWRRPSFYGGPTARPTKRGWKGARRYDPAERVNVSRALRRLEDRGLVERLSWADLAFELYMRAPDEAAAEHALRSYMEADDKRARYVQLTAAGERVASALAEDGAPVELGSRFAETKAAAWKALHRGELDDDEQTNLIRVWWAEARDLLRKARQHPDDPDLRAAAVTVLQSFGSSQNG